MATDNELLRDIIPYFNDKNFDARFEEITVQMSKSRRFLLKMELNRLFTPCRRTIDLRGRVDNNCDQFEYFGQTHYLDTVAVEKFEESVSIYNNFTIGVFEDVTNTGNSYRAKQLIEDQQRRDNLKNQQHRQRSIAANSPERSPHQAEIVSLTQFNQRREERTNIISKIEIRLGNGHQLQGITSNLSVGGSKIKIPAQYEINPGETVYINFMAIERTEDQHQIKEIAYTVLATTIQNNFIWLNTVRQHKDQRVAQFLHDFISKQRKSSVIDTAHIIEAIRSLGYQQLLISKLSGLPLFFSKQKNKFKLELALCNFDNKKILSYWQNQSNLQKIAAIFSDKRLSQLLNGSLDVHSTTLYCFTHVARGKKFFYSATSQELQQTGLMDLYSSFGAAKDSWQVYQLFLCPTDTKQWQLPEVLPDHLIKRENISPAQHKHLLKLHNIELMAYLIPISDNDSKTLYQQCHQDNNDLTQLQQFGHSDSVPTGLSLIDSNQLVQRHEDRYSYQTKVLVHYNQQSLNAKTIDFSTQGMQIKLARSIACKQGDTLNLQMPLLQRFSGSEHASHISYQVIRIAPDGKVLNLKVVSSKEYIDGPKNIYRLIKNNQHRLTAQVSPPASFIKSLNLLFSNHIACLPLIIAKQGNHFKVSKVIEPSGSNRLYNLFSALSPDPQFCNVAPLAKNNLFKELFERPLKQLSPRSEPISTEVYIQLFSESTSHHYTYVTQIAAQLKDAQQHRAFISQQRGQFFAIRIVLSRSDKIDYKSVSREIIYAAKQASYKTSQVQTELDSIIAVAELIDITQEVKARFGSA